MSDEIGDLARRLGEVLSGHYELDELAGRGGMAFVFRAHDVKHDRYVAVKVLKPELTSAIGAERFLREIRTTASFAHPHILTLIDSGVAGDILYYVMPFIDGESLRQKLLREKQLSLEDTLGITRDVASALSYAHDRGVVHRDIKPENVLLHEGTALVTDFGIAIAALGPEGQRLTETGFSLGTPAYMSPEQATGDREVDSRSDVYSLGCITYEMLTGEPPHRGATAGATFSKMMTERPTAIKVVRDNVPPHVETAVMRALAKVPGDRFQTTDKFTRALDDAYSTPTPIPSPSAKKNGAGRYTVPLAAAVLLAIGAIGFMLRSDGPVGSVGDPVTRQQTFTGDAEQVSLSPDGMFVAYLTNGRRTLSVQDLDGGGELTLFESSEPIGPPKWNRGGTRILIHASVEGDGGLYTIPRLGGDLTLRTPVRTPGRGIYAFGSEDSTIAVFCCGGRLYVGTDPSTVLKARPALEGTADVTSVADFVAEIAPSPDGRFIAFVGGFLNERTVIAVVPVGGNEPSIITSRDGSWFEAERLAFSSLRWPTDDRLFFTESSGSSAKVVAVSIDRSGNSVGEARTVFSNIPAGSVFDVAPQDGRLVYSGGSERTRLEMVERGVPGSIRLGTGTYSYRRPSISPDGEWLAYHRGTGDLVELLVSRLPDGEPRVILAGHRPLGPAAWAPHSAQLAVMVSDGSESSIRVVDVLSREEVIILDAAVGGRIIWSRSEEELSFFRAGVGLVSLRISDRTETPGALGRLFRGTRACQTGGPAAHDWPGRRSADADDNFRSNWRRDRDLPRRFSPRSDRIEHCVS